MATDLDVHGHVDGDRVAPIHSQAGAARWRRGSTGSPAPSGSGWTGGSLPSGKTTAVSDPRPKNSSRQCFSRAPGQPSHLLHSRCRIQDLDRRGPEPDPQLTDHQIPVPGAVLDGPGVELGIRLPDPVAPGSAPGSFFRTDSGAGTKNGARGPRRASLSKHGPVQTVWWTGNG